MHGSDTHIKNIILYNIPHMFLSWVLLFSLYKINHSTRYVLTDSEGCVACLHSHALSYTWAYNIIYLFFPTILQMLVLYHSTPRSITSYTYIPGVVL